MANAIVEQSGDTDSDDDLSKVGDDDHSPRRHDAALFGPSSSSASDPSGHNRKRKQVRGKVYITTSTNAVPSCQAGRSCCFVLAVLCTFICVLLFGFAKLLEHMMVSVRSSHLLCFCDAHLLPAS